MNLLYSQKKKISTRWRKRSVFGGGASEQKQTLKFHMAWKYSFVIFDTFYGFSGLRHLMYSQSFGSILLMTSFDCHVMTFCHFFLVTMLFLRRQQIRKVVFLLFRAVEEGKRHKEYKILKK